MPNAEYRGTEVKKKEATRKYNSLDGAPFWASAVHWVPGYLGGEEVGYRTVLYEATNLLTGISLIELLAKERAEMHWKKKKTETAVWKNKKKEIQNEIMKKMISRWVNMLSQSGKGIWT